MIPMIPTLPMLPELKFGPQIHHGAERMKMFIVNAESEFRGLSLWMVGLDHFQTFQYCSPSSL